MFYDGKQRRLKPPSRALRSEGYGRWGLMSPPRQAPAAAWHGVAGHASSAEGAPQRGRQKHAVSAQHAAERSGQQVRRRSSPSGSWRREQQQRDGGLAAWPDRVEIGRRPDGRRTEREHGCFRGARRAKMAQPCRDDEIVAARRRFLGFCSSSRAAGSSAARPGASRAAETYTALRCRSAKKWR